MKKKDIWKEEINMLQLSLLFFEFDMVKCKLYQEYIYRCLKKNLGISVCIICLLLRL